MDIYEVKRLKNNNDTKENDEESKRTIDSRQGSQSFSFISKNKNRLLVGILLSLIGILDAVILGVNIGDAETLGNAGMGTALILGGFSWFYFAGLIPLITGISLIIYYFTSIWRGKIILSEQSFMFHEVRFKKDTAYIINKDEIDGFQYQNNLIGPKKGWVFLFVPLSVYILLYGLVLFDQPRAERITLPLLMVLSVVIMMISMIILIINPQQHLELVSKENYYDYWFTPEKIKLDQNESLEKLFEFEECRDKIIINGNKENLKNPINISDIQSKEAGCISILDWKTIFRLVLGIVLTLTGLISAFGEIWFGYQFFYIAIPYGIILIFESLLCDFNSEFTIKWDKPNQKISVFRKFKSKYHYKTFTKFTQVQNRYVLKKIDLFDVISAPIILYYGITQIVLGWLESDLSTSAVLLDMISSTILIVIIAVFIFVYWLVSVPSLSIQSGSIINHIELPVNPLLKYFKRHLIVNRDEKLEKIQYNHKDKAGILLRWIILVLMIIIPIVDTLNRYFIV